MAAFAATTIFAVSCDKSGGGDEPEPNGAEGRMGLTISFPQSGDTRATDGNASAQDNTVNSIDVFIFDEFGRPARGNDTPLDVTADFIYDSAAKTYTLNDASFITTTVGMKHVYVGINLPSGLNDVAGEVSLKDAFANFNATGGAPLLYNNTDATKGPAMLSAKCSINVTEAGPNVASAAVTRMVAKVTAVKGATLTSTPTGHGSNPGFAVNVEKYTVGNVAKRVYPLKRVKNSLLITPGDNADDTKATASKSALVNGVSTSIHPERNIDANGTGVSARKYLYVPEHSTSTQYLRNEATYALIYATFTFTNYADAMGTNITQTAAPTTSAANKTIYVVRGNGRVYFCETEAARNAVLTALGMGTGASNYMTYKSDASGKFHTFYHVFINKGDGTSTDRLSVHRNKIYDILINNVVSIGVPGEDGGSTPPTQPQDPTEPVYEKSANLDVHIDVAKWDYDQAPTSLQ